MRVPARRTPGRRRVVLGPLLALLLLACDESAPTASSEPVEPVPGAVHAEAVEFECIARVGERVLECAPAAPGVEGSSPALIGGQDVDILLESSGTSYNAANELFSTEVTVQNLTRHLIGTSDGVIVDGVQVVFAGEPHLIAGSGEVVVANHGGLGHFLHADQPYFSYPHLLEPLEISPGKWWSFNVPETVIAFGFSVFVSAPMVEEGADLQGAVWTGALGSDWSNSLNWAGGIVPGPTESVHIPSLSRLGPGSSMPISSGGAEVLHLRVGAGSSLDLDGSTLLVRGNLDIAGEVIAGTVALGAEESLVGGELPALEVTGGAVLQRPVVASGPVSIDGSLAAPEAIITIAIP